MPDVTPICPACGARLAPGASACDLCGHDLSQPVPTDATDDALTPIPDAGSTGDGAGEASGVFCTACGVRNHVGSNFCAQCGARLTGALNAPTLASGAVRADPATDPAAIPVAAPPEAAVTPAAARRMALLLGAALLLVAGLYLATAASKRQGNTGPAFRSSADVAAGGVSQEPAPATAPGTELSDADAERVQDLESRAAGATGAEQTRLRRELANLLFGLGQTARAAEVEEAIAQSENTAEAWLRAGDRYYAVMQGTPETDRGPVAARVVAAYDRVLALNPNDLDARTRLGWAAQYDASGNPMRAITETNAVLERDSLALGANYNRGWFLARIGRVDQAILQFRKVQRLAGSDSPLGREAESIIETLEQNGTPVAGPTAPGPQAAPGAPATGTAPAAPSGQ